MNIIKAVPVSPGIGIGPVFCYTRNTQITPGYYINNVEEEIHRYLTARDRSVKELLALYRQVSTDYSEKEAGIFEANALMLEDEDFSDCVVQIIRSKNVNAEYGVQEAAVQFSEMLAQTGDEYLATRAADLQDIAGWVIAHLSNTDLSLLRIDSPAILVSEDLFPSELVQSDRKNLIALVTAQMSANSHTAILARSMNIPAVSGIGMAGSQIISGTRLVVDGDSGAIYINPDPKTLEEFETMAKRQAQERTSLRVLVGCENRTKDGRLVEVYANVGTREDIESALKNDAGGIGLFRSEMAYLGRTDYPTEDELFALYRDAARQMGNRRIIIRTVDIGGDKDAPYFHLEKENNPALGMRGIRLCLARPEMFKTQLRAILRASVFGNLAIMFPMITAAFELDRIEEILRGVREDLMARNVRFNEDISLGIMIETPAAALLSDILAKQSSFFSIGTNDLAQYTLAIDRQNPSFQEYGDVRNEAVLRLIEMTIRNAHKAGIPVGICGELGADPEMTAPLLAMGIDEFSVAPASVLPLRKRIRDYSSPDTIEM